MELCDSSCLSVHVFLVVVGTSRRTTGMSTVFRVWAMLTLRKRSLMVHAPLARHFPSARCARDSGSSLKDPVSPRLLAVLVLLPPRYFRNCARRPTTPSRLQRSQRRLWERRSPLWWSRNATCESTWLRCGRLRKYAFLTPHLTGWSLW